MAARHAWLISVAAFLGPLCVSTSIQAQAPAAPQAGQNVGQRAVLRARNATDWVVRDSYEPTAARLLYTSARSLGMLRGLAEANMIVRLRYQGAGTTYPISRERTWPALKLDNYYVEISYPDQGMRVDMTTAAGRQVQVVAGTQAWDEKQLAPTGPSVGATQLAMPAAAKERHLWLTMTPYAAIAQAHDNVDKVKITALEHGSFLLTYPFEGQNMKVWLDRNRRPARVETDYVHPVLGKTTLTAEYSGYKDYEPISQFSDEPYSDFFFPQHIVNKVGGRTVLDVNIATCWCVNPYVIFPPRN